MPSVPLIHHRAMLILQSDEPEKGTENPYGQGGI
jgi:hypothetical protein